MGDGYALIHGSEVAPAGVSSRCVLINTSEGDNKWTSTASSARSSLAS